MPKTRSATEIYNRYQLGVSQYKPAGCEKCRLLSNYAVFLPPSTALVASASRGPAVRGDLGQALGALAEREVSVRGARLLHVRGDVREGRQAQLVPRSAPAPVP